MDRLVVVVLHHWRRRNHPAVIRDANAYGASRVRQRSCQRVRGCPINEAHFLASQRPSHQHELQLVADQRVERQHPRRDCHRVVHDTRRHVQVEERTALARSVQRTRTRVNRTEHDVPVLDERQHHHVAREVRARDGVLERPLMPRLLHLVVPVPVVLVHHEAVRVAARGEQRQRGHTRRHREPAPPTHVLREVRRAVLRHVLRVRVVRRDHFHRAEEVL